MLEGQIIAHHLFSAAAMCGNARAAGDAAALLSQIDPTALSNLSVVVQAALRMQGAAQHSPLRPLLRSASGAPARGREILPDGSQGRDVVQDSAGGWAPDGATRRAKEEVDGQGEEPR